MQDSPSQNRVDQRLTILQRLANVMSERVDKLYNLLTEKHLASLNNFASQRDQTPRGYKTSYGKFQKGQGRSNPTTRTNNSHLIIEHHDHPIMEEHHLQISAAGQPTSVVENQPAPATTRPQTFFPPDNRSHPVGIPNVHQSMTNIAYGYDARNNQEGFNSGRINHHSPQEEQLNKWDACSCVLFWLGLSHVLGGIAMVIFGTLQVLKFMGFLCISPYKKTNGRCCIQEQCVFNNLEGEFINFIILGILGVIVIFLGIFFLNKTCRMYKNNNDDCCPECC